MTEIKVSQENNYRRNGMDKHEHMGHHILAAWMGLLDFAGNRRYDKSLARGYTVRELYRLCEKANEIDGTGFLTFSIAYDFYRPTLELLSVSYFDALSRSGDFAEIKRLTNEMDILFTEDFVQAWESQKKYMSEGVAFYRKTLSQDEISEAVESQAAITAVRARECVKNSLKHRVLCTGSLDTENLRVCSDIFYFRGVSSMLRLAKELPDSTMSLSVIFPEGEKVDPYFALIVKSGGHLSLFTDEPKHEHPLQSRMRRNSRSIVNRIDASSFPYEILNLVSSDNERVLTSEKDSTSLVVESGKPIVVSKFSDISESSMMFMQALFEQIRTDFHVLPKGIPSLPTSILKTDETDRSELFPVALAEESYVLPVFDMENTSREAFAATQGENLNLETSNNLWMESFFKEEVKQMMTEMGVSNFLPLGGESVFLLPGEVKHPFGWVNGHNSGAIKFYSLDDDIVLSPKEIMEDGAWLARQNYASLLKAVVHADYKKNRGGMIQFMADTMKQRITADSEFFTPLADFSESVYTLTKEDVQLSKSYPSTSNGGGFGRFSTKDVPARMGRNPATGESMSIAAKRKVKFSVGKNLAESVL